MKENTNKTSLIQILLIIIGTLSILFSLVDTNISIQPSKLARKIYTQITGRVISSQDLDYYQLSETVTPKEGISIKANWGDLGIKLVGSGAIDLSAFEERYNGLNDEQKKVISGNNLSSITFTTENIQFWTNVLWALGLTQESKVLSEGPMEQNKESTPIENYASTAGWTLGSKPAMDLYNSSRLIELTPEQDELVYKIAENIFRPCCGNHTAFPDCNHGMAVLGLLELMASQGASEEEMYKASLAFNSYAFSSTYINTAAYFQMQGIDWSEISPKNILGSQFSSGQGASFISKEVGEIPGAPKKGASCGA